MAFRSFFFEDICQTSIHLDFFRFFYYLCLKGGGYQKQRTSEKLSSVFALRLADWLFFVLFGIGKPIMNSVLLAFLDAIHADNTAAAVYLIVCGINT